MSVVVPALSGYAIAHCTVVHLSSRADHIARGSNQLDMLQKGLYFAVDSVVAIYMMWFDVSIS